MAKKYYWLKLHKDFFKRHDIRIIEDMPNGKDYVLFYLKLLVESIGHEGELRFNETIPYDENMLATITNTNIDVVRSAVKIFRELKLMEMYEDGTIFMGEVQKMIGSQTEWAEKKRIYREKQKQLQQGQKEDMSDKSKIQSKSKEKDTDKEKRDLFFESIWQLYPNKKGKAQISDSKKKELYKHKDELPTALERYKKYLAANEWLKPQNGSTWFNKGYVDYLDENYTEPINLEELISREMIRTQKYEETSEELKKHVKREEWYARL